MSFPPDAMRQDWLYPAKLASFLFSSILKDHGKSKRQPWGCSHVSRPQRLVRLLVPCVPENLRVGFRVRLYTPTLPDAGRVLQQGSPLGETHLPRGWKAPCSRLRLVTEMAHGGLQDFATAIPKASEPQA